MSVGKNIKRYRKSKGWSITKLADETSLNVTTLYRYEHDKVKPKTDNLNKIAKALSVSVIQLENLETGKENCLSETEIAQLVIEFCKIRRAHV